MTFSLARPPGSDWMTGAMGQEGHPFKYQLQTYSRCRSSRIDVFHNTRDILLDIAINMPL